MGKSEMEIGGCGDREMGVKKQFGVRSKMIMDKVMGRHGDAVIESS